MDWSGIDYLGIDVVEHLIVRNQALYSSPTIQFLHTNALVNLPSADLLICKDVLQHLPNAYIFHFLTQMSRLKHCLITNCTDAYYLTSANHDVPVGHFRQLDLTRPPFSVKGTKILSYHTSVRTTKQVLHVNNSETLQ